MGPGHPEGSCGTTPGRLQCRLHPCLFVWFAPVINDSGCLKTWCLICSLNLSGYRLQPGAIYLCVQALEVGTMGEGVGAPQWVGDEPKKTIFPVSCWNRFPAAESYRHHGAHGGKKPLPLQRPIGKPQAPRVPWSLLFVVNQGCLWMAAQTVKLQRGYCELAGFEGKSLEIQLCHLKN